MALLGGQSRLNWEIPQTALGLSPFNEKLKEHTSLAVPLPAIVSSCYAHSAGEGDVLLEHLN